MAFFFNLWKEPSHNNKHEKDICIALKQTKLAYTSTQNSIKRTILK